MNDSDVIAVVTAHKAGEKIQCRRLCEREYGRWLDVTPNDFVGWNFEEFRYRVAPEPRKPREWRLKFENSLITGHSEAIDANFTKDWVLVREVLENE